MQVPRRCAHARCGRRGKHGLETNNADINLVLSNHRFCAAASLGMMLAMSRSDKAATRLIARLRRVMGRLRAAVDRRFSGRYPCVRLRMMPVTTAEIASAYGCLQERAEAGRWHACCLCLHRRKPTQTSEV
jgi:hypothetical protein